MRDVLAFLGGDVLGVLTVTAIAAMGLAFLQWRKARQELTVRRAAEHRVRESEERFRSLIEYAAEGVALVDRGGRMLYQTPSMYRITGHQPEERLGGDVFDLVHPDDVAKMRELFRAITESPQRVEAAELRVRHRAGGWRTVRCAAQNLLAVPSVAAVVINCSDITEQREAEAALREREADQHRLQEEVRQAQKLEAVGRLAGGVAQDFNNLLTAILGNVAVVLARDDLAEPLRADLTTVQRLADRAAALTLHLLAFSRKQILEPRAVDVNIVVREMRATLGRLIGEHIELILELDPRAGHIHADPTRLEQVIVNLVVNARDAMPHGGRMTIETAHRPGQDADGVRDMVVLRVTDTGIGMDEATRDRIFEPFFTTKPPGRGTGLGLSTVYGIVQQSGGRMHVRSVPGVGSTFEAWLPVEHPPGPGAADLAALVREVVEPSRPRPSSVLVVEDEPAVRTLVSRVLRMHGYSVLEASSGTDALAHYQSAAPEIDLLLSDVVMPGLGGVEVAQRFRQLNAAVRVLFMSGYTGQDIDSEHGRLSDAELLEKPFTPETLLAAVRRALTHGPRTTTRTAAAPAGPATD